MRMLGIDPGLRSAVVAALFGTPFAAMTAAAQGPPPFELDSDASRSTQVVRMQLGLRDVEEPSSTDSEFEAQSPFQATLNRTQESAGVATGRLVMFPVGTSAPLLPVAGGTVLPVQPSDSGSTFFLVLETPSVTGGFWAPYVQVGTYDYDITCSSAVCNQWLEGSIESRAESSFDHAAGTLEVDASVITPDYGITDDTEDIYHALRSTAFARLGDWIYATGAGETATVTIAATLPVSLDAPDDDTSGPSGWLTQGSGDLRELGCFGPIEPNVIQYTRFRFDIELTQWSFEEVCEEEGEGGEPICNDEWVDAPIGTHTVSREREMHTVACESSLDLVSSDTGALPSSTQLEVEIPTHQWVQLYVTTSTDADCEGAFDCDLDARTSSPIEVSIASPNGELVAWRGIAGLTTVPEPGDAASIAAALAAIASLSCRQRNSR
jgi:hypothetical protein